MLSGNVTGSDPASVICHDTGCPVPNIVRSVYGENACSCCVAVEEGTGVRAVIRDP